MERGRRNTPVNNPHHSTADLLSWPSSDLRRPVSSSSDYHSIQASDGVGDILGGGCKITNEETESLNKNVTYKKNCCEQKLKEMNGSDLFSDNGRDEPIHRTINHYHQDQTSHISFRGVENALSPMETNTLTDAEKPNEFIDSVESEEDSMSNKKKKKNEQISNSETEAITGHDDILAAARQEDKGNKNTEQCAPRNLCESDKASNGQSGDRMLNEEQNVVESTREKKIQNPEFQELTGNGTFVFDKLAPGHSEKMHSSAKLREMSGNHIFQDGKSEYREYYGGKRRPPGGESTISFD
ncbi:unnamed protein product [Cochlearia groenlandica]